MFLTRHQSYSGPRWALDGKLLPDGVNLGTLLAVPKAQLMALLRSFPTGEDAAGALLAPLEAELRARTGCSCFGVDGQSLAAVVLERLQQRGQRIAAAEHGIRCAAHRFAEQCARF